MSVNGAAFRQLRVVRNPHRSFFWIISLVSLHRRIIPPPRSIDLSMTQLATRVVGASGAAVSQWFNIQRAMCDVAMSATRNQVSVLCYDLNRESGQGCMT
eukprot:scaffold3445_cov118-Isochrysis_galbana.AAC.5